VARGRGRRLTSLADPPRVVKPATWAPVTGCFSTPAFTGEDWIVPAARSADTTQSP
jgi:hypothetical protein